MDPKDQWSQEVMDHNITAQISNLSKLWIPKDIQSTTIIYILYLKNYCVLVELFYHNKINCTRFFHLPQTIILLHTINYTDFIQLISGFFSLAANFLEYPAGKTEAFAATIK